MSKRDRRSLWRPARPACLLAVLLNLLAPAIAGIAMAGAPVPICTPDGVRYQHVADPEGRCCLGCPLCRFVPALALPVPGHVLSPPSWQAVEPRPPAAAHPVAVGPFETIRSRGPPPFA